MKTSIPFELVVDKATKTVSFSREFDAELALVWDAFTKKEILDQWWAPKPYMSKTKVMDFKVGGRRFYAMVSPEGLERWGVQKYTSITPKTNFKLFNTFADKDENIEPTGSDWDFNFTDMGDTTNVTITIKNESLERFERVLASGFKEGTQAQVQNLEELLETLKKKS